MTPATGSWWILVQSWTGSGSRPDAVHLAYGMVDADQSNLQVSGPMAVPANTEFGLTLLWDEATMQAEGIGFTAAFRSERARTNRATSAGLVDLVRHPDDVAKTADVVALWPGEAVTYTITVEPDRTAGQPVVQPHRCDSRWSELLARVGLCYLGGDERVRKPAHLVGHDAGGE